MTFASLESDPFVRAVIYPGIGVARVGNSTHPTDDFYDGPEVDMPLYSLQQQLRDPAGRLKRQAQRFRVYGYRKSGKIEEITVNRRQGVKIDWTVHLANKKASWYRFDVAMDIEESKQAAVPMPLRNASVADRKSLNLDPGPRTISGANVRGPEYRFDGQKFMGLDVNLGELRTDERGRLRVLGGMGKGGTPEPSRYPVFVPEDGMTFNNADGWYDDIADGPVRATVTIGRPTLVADSAWVVAAPPNYAPDVIGFRTMYDLMLSLYVKEKPEWVAHLTSPSEETSFTRHILPVLRRMSNLQWVNKGFSDRVGFLTDSDPLDSKFLTEVSSNLGASATKRRQVVSRFRTEEMGFNFSKQPHLWPMMYGDAFGSFDESKKVRFVVSREQMRHLNNWALGKFVADYDPPAPPPPKSLAEVPVEKQPAMLDKAALDSCLADAFHPGCELTWPMRHISLYRAAFRIREGKSAQDYGQTLTPAMALASNGPLHEQSAGDLTKWMAVPWHGDTAFCRSGYEPSVDPFLPTFWPAAVPNHVLQIEDYNKVMDKSLSMAAREEAFGNRQHWLRSLRGGPVEQINQMVDHFANVGVLVAKRGPGDGRFPPLILVEDRRPIVLKVGGGLESAPAPVPVVESQERAAADPETMRARTAGWESVEQLEAFRRIRIRRPTP